MTSMIVQEVSAKIRHYKKQLSNKPITENFGQAQVRKLMDKYSQCAYADPESRRAFALILSFGDWCMNYTGRQGETPCNPKKTRPNSGRERTSQ